MAAPKAIVSPDRQQIEAVVWDNIHKVEGLSISEVETISAFELARQNTHSSRVGGEIRIHLKGDARPDIKLWAKWVDRPTAAYEKMSATYARAASHGLAYPMPRPYFCDAQTSLVFMAQVAGRPLRHEVLRYSTGLGPAQQVPPPLVLGRFGQWLSRLHSAVQFETRYRFDELAESIQDRLEADTSFTRWQQRNMVSHLRTAHALVSRPGSAHFELWPHNDLTLRNILVNDNGEFFALDWDAMAHPDFSETSIGWWDVTVFLVNLESLGRFTPFVRASRLRELACAFLSGYLDAADTSVSQFGLENIEHILYIFTLRLWYAIGTDRRLAEVYRRRLGWRYAREVRRRLSIGPSAMLGK